MRNLITVLAILFCTLSYSQKLSIQEGSTKKKTTIKIEFPTDYNLLFYNNDVLIKSLRFKGTKYFTIEDFEEQTFTFRDNKKLGSFELYFLNDLEDFKRDQAIDFQTDY